MAAKPTLRDVMLTLASIKSRFMEQQDLQGGRKIIQNGGKTLQNGRSRNQSSFFRRIPRFPN